MARTKRSHPSSRSSKPSLFFSPDGAFGMSDFTEYELNPFHLPDRLLRAIGLATASFAQTESVLRDAIAGCAGLDIEYGGAITTHMTLPLCFSALRSVAEIRIDDLDALDALDELMNDVQLASEKRNDIAHNAWSIDPENGATGYLKTTARTSFDMKLIPKSADDVEADAIFIYEAGMKLMQFLMTHGLLPSFPSEPRPRAQKSKAARKKRREKV
jgi:hypothetical protein